MERLCPDCAVPTEQPHHPDCDIAVCLETGRQRLGCPRPGGHDCGADIWTGQRVGEAEAREYGWLVRWTGAPAAGGVGWQPTSDSDPGALPDLNRVYAECVWDRSQRRWRWRDRNGGGHGR